MIRSLTVLAHVAPTLSSEWLTNPDMKILANNCAENVNARQRSIYKLANEALANA